MCTAKGSDVRPGVPWAPPLLRGRPGTKGSDVRPGVPWAPPLLRGRRGTMCTAKGSDVRPGVPWAPPLLRGRRGTMCTAKGSDVRPGVPWAPPLLRGRRGTKCTAKGSDVRPGVPWAPPLLRGFAWQAWDNVHCQGVGCTPWRPLGSASFAWICVAGVGQCALPRDVRPGVPWAPPLLRGRRGTMCIAKGLDVRPGVPWAPPLLRRFAWQAWDNVHCQGVGCTPWRPLGSASFAWICVAGVGQCALPRGRMYALASLGLRLFCVDLRGRRGTMCIAKGSDVRPGVPWAPPLLRGFAWQAWDNVHCQGVGCTPWRPLGSASFAWICVAGVGQCALPRGRMYALASLGLRLFCVDLRGRRGTMCIAKGSDVRPGVPWAPPLLRGRRGTMCILRGRRGGTMCIAKGSDVRPGVPWAPPLLRGKRGTIMCILRGRCGAMWTAKGSDVCFGVPWRSLTHSLTLPYSLTLTHSHSLSHLLTHSLTLSVTHIHTKIDGWMDG